jgi:3-oxoacyl-[acyl-carrier protein] reductase
MRLEDKVAIVTGAGQGIGRAYTLRFVQEGAHVVIADIQEDKAHKVAREVQDSGGKGLAVKVDVSEPGSVRDMVDQAVERFGCVDVLVNNAAIFATIKMKPFEEITLDEWNRLMAVNLAGPFLCCQAVSPHMRERKQGRIINISSNAVLSGLPLYTHYVTSKAGIIGLTRALANELGGDDITVNTIIPGFTETEIPRETVSPERAKAMVQAQAIQRRETPEDLAGVAVFLASEDSRFITGQVVNVDGGLNFY